MAHSLCSLRRTFRENWSSDSACLDWAPKRRLPVLPMVCCNFKKVSSSASFFEQISRIGLVGLSGNLDSVEMLVWEVCCQDLPVPGGPSTFRGHEGWEAVDTGHGTAGCRLGISLWAPAHSLLRQGYISPRGCMAGAWMCHRYRRGWLHGWEHTCYKSSDLFVASRALPWDS